MSNQRPAARASASAKRETGLTDDLRGPMREAYPDGLEAPPLSYPYAYAIIEGPPGKWSAVCFEGVTAREVVRLEPNGQAEPPARAMMRIQSAISQRTIAKKWGRT